MNRRGFLKEGLSAIGTVLIPGSGTRTLKDKITVLKKALSEALEDNAVWKRLANSWFIHVSNLQDERIDLLKDLEERNKEIRRLNTHLSMLWHTRNFWQTAYRQEHDHNDWLREMLDLEMAETSNMYDRWQAAVREREELEGRLQETEARTRCVESAYEELWKASARDQVLLEKYITKKYLTLMSKDRESRLMLTDGVTTIDLSDEGCGGVVTIPRSN